MTSPQAPIGSHFGAASTATDVLRGIDLGGKTAIVTGGYAGLGLETARVLRAAGATVVVPARDLPKATAALASVNVEIATMDLMNPSSVEAFATGFLQSGRPLHILVNSAGIMACPLARDARGYESQLATNHLGHFQLTTRLLPALRSAKGARVVSVSSRGHQYAPFHFEDPSFERRAYDPWLAYGQSKTANILFALELDRREESNGIRALSLHPGSIVGTDLGKHVSREQLVKLGVIDDAGNAIIDPARGLKTVAQGASTQVWCAASPDVDGHGGVYCENCEVTGTMKTGGDDVLATTGVKPYAVDPELAARLWTLSETLTGSTTR